MDALVGEHIATHTSASRSSLAARYSYAVGEFLRQRLLFLPLPLPTIPPNVCADENHQVLHTANQKWVILRDEEEIERYLPILQRGGAKKIKGLFDFGTDAKIQIETRGWSVILRCDLRDPYHHGLKPPQCYCWDQNSKKQYLPWNGEIYTTRKS